MSKNLGTDIQQEYTSQPNELLVLHDYKGFESRDLSDFRIVREFVEQRSRPELSLSDRIHGIWYLSFFYNLRTPLQHF